MKQKLKHVTQVCNKNLLECFSVGTYIKWFLCSLNCPMYNVAKPRQLFPSNQTFSLYLALTDQSQQVVPTSRYHMSKILNSSYFYSVDQFSTLWRKSKKYSLDLLLIVANYLVLCHCCIFRLFSNRYFVSTRRFSSFCLIYCFLYFRDENRWTFVSIYCMFLGTEKFCMPKMVEEPS